MTKVATDVEIPAGDGRIAADLSDDVTARPVVVFAHGAGSSRHSPRNRQVATRLNRAGLVTLLLDLLTEQEESADAATGHLRFDINLLTDRLLAATHWLDRRGSGPVGYFGASTGAGAALSAAARPGTPIRAVVSRGGRPDLAGDCLASVTAPTLLIVGGRDPTVHDLNRQALRLLAGRRRLEIIPGATHLFEEPGALERVADLAVGWFNDHLRSGDQPGS